MLHNLARLSRYRGLIQSLVARELKAKYRGSVLGFFWSFINPLLLLLVYSFVFKYLLPAKWQGIDHYELFLFSAEILPIVTVLANLVHFLLGLTILAVFLVYYQRPLHLAELAWFPVVV